MTADHSPQLHGRHHKSRNSHFALPTSPTFFVDPSLSCDLSSGSRWTCRTAAALSRPRMLPFASALASKGRPAWCATPCCRRIGAKRRRSISCPTDAAPPLRPSSWWTATPSKWVNGHGLTRLKRKQAKRQLVKCPSLPTGGSKRRSLAGIQAQDPSRQGGHLLHIWGCEGARDWLHPELSECAPGFCSLYMRACF